MSVVTKNEISIGEYLPIYLETLRIDSALDFDLYVKKGTEFILFRASNLPFTEKNRTALLENKIDRLYIHAEKQHEYQRYVEKNIKAIITDSNINETTKAGIIYNCAKLLVKDVLTNPTLGENIRRSKLMVESTVSLILSEESAFHNLLKMMSFDYSTYTHSVNVCTFSLALARFIGIKDEEELNQLGNGALLHDIGKTKVPQAILNKRGPLDLDEMDIIKNHPQWGIDIINKTNLMSKESSLPILQHHERMDKSGYPHGIGNNDIHNFSKIVAISDVFDAMTTERVYRSAVETFPALMVMFGQKDGFDDNLLEEFTKLLGPSDLLN